MFQATVQREGTLTAQESHRIEFGVQLCGKEAKILRVKYWKGEACRNVEFQRPIEGPFKSLAKYQSVHTCEITTKHQEKNHWKE